VGKRQRAKPTDLYGGAIGYRLQVGVLTIEGSYGGSRIDLGTELARRLVNARLRKS
jgi:hypothetical protein